MSKDTYPKVFRWDSKHEPSYYLCADETQKNNMFLKILKERFRSGMYDWMKRASMGVRQTYSKIERVCTPGTLITDNYITACVLLTQLRDGEYEGFSEIHLEYMD